jgi:hypothetical protein
LVSGYLSIRVGDRLHNIWNGTDRAYARQCPGEAVLWHQVAWAIDSGVRAYDQEGIDESNNPGCYQFKKRLGGEEIELPGLRAYPLGSLGRVAPKLALSGSFDGTLGSPGRQRSTVALPGYMSSLRLHFGLVRDQRDCRQTREDALLGENLSQPWRLFPGGQQCFRVAPESHPWRCADLARIAARPDVVHLAGWGHFLVMFALVVAAALRVPVTMESDTQLRFDAPAWATHKV